MWNIGWDGRMSESKRDNVIKRRKMVRRRIENQRGDVINQYTYREQYVW